MIKTVLLIDGGHLRFCAGAIGRPYDPDFIEAFGKGCHLPNSEDLLRVLYYDCAQFRGKRSSPISGTLHNFTSSDKWLDDLGQRDLFAIRRGTMAFRGWQPRNIPVANRAALTDADFKPVFEQKGVDMRIGLDIATMSYEKRIDRILICSADTDLIPAMKHARKSGMQVVALQLPIPPAILLRPQFLAHCDLKRDVTFPPLPLAVPAPTPNP